MVDSILLKSRLERDPEMLVEWGQLWRILTQREVNGCFTYQPELPPQDPMLEQNHLEHKLVPGIKPPASSHMFPSSPGIFIATIQVWHIANPSPDSFILVGSQQFIDL